MTSLSVQPATFSMPPAAVFNGKASIQDFTNPDAPLSVDGNATLQVTMTDFGESGGEQNLSNPDRIAITVWDKSGGLWFASSWNGKKTIEQRLEAGNLKINSSGSVVTGTYPSKTELASSTDEPVPGDPIIFTATVTGQTTMKPTGTVTFIDYFNSTFSILGNPALNQGSATLNVSSLASGLHEIYAFYGGDSKYKSSTGFLLQKVNLAATAFNSFANVSPVIENANWKVYPNPFSESLHFEFMSPVDTKAQIKIFDNTGRIIKTIFNNPVKADVTYHAEFTPTTSTSGFYLFQIVIGSEIFNGKAIYKE